MTIFNGTAGNDILTGADENDALDGLSGADKISGGAGDVVQELANGGIDTIFTSIDFTLGASVENAVLIGGNQTVAGNDLNNVIVGGGSD